MKYDAEFKNHCQTTKQKLSLRQGKTISKFSIVDDRARIYICYVSMRFSPPSS